MKAALRKILMGTLLSATPLWTFSAFAGPMGFAESTMSMGDFSSNWREAFVNYALTSKDAIGTEAVYMRSDNKLTTLHATGLTYTRLAKRWNMPEAQANVWLIGGLSTATGSEFLGSKTLLSPGVQVDYDEVQPWFIVEARRMKGLSDKTEITPMLRLIHNRYFVEAGVSTERQARLNFMYIF